MILGGLQHVMQSLGLHDRKKAVELCSVNIIVAPVSARSGWSATRGRRRMLQGCGFWLFWKVKNGRSRGRLFIREVDAKHVVTCRRRVPGPGVLISEPGAIVCKLPP
ncbi:hypothetical protein J6590_006318 [Homalodisca vitripennis]|nr:hypothetical protein J6590_006318 [Homalodisca vitripennis]